MEYNPLVTVNILSFNRKDELKITLIKVFEQDYRNIEVIVVDNASTDGSPEMIKKEFNSVNLIRLTKNMGIAGWNEGLKISKGKYILILDDDAYPEKQSILLSVKELENNPIIGAISFNIYNILQNKKIYRFPGGWLPPDNIEQCSWHYVIGCAFVIKKSLFTNNLFPSGYFICLHELPIVRYLIVNNNIIFYNRNIVAYHLNQSSNGLNPLKEYYHYRNLLNFALWNIALPLNLFYGIRIIIFFLTRSIKKGWFQNYIRALFHQTKNLQGYKLRKMNKAERNVFFGTEFVEYKF